MFNNNCDRVSMNFVKVEEDYNSIVSDQLTDFFIDNATTRLRNEDDEIEYAIYDIETLKELKKEIEDESAFNSNTDEEFKKEAKETVDRLIEICKAQPERFIFLSVL